MSLLRALTIISTMTIISGCSNDNFIDAYHSECADDVDTPAVFTVMTETTAKLDGVICEGTPDTLNELLVDYPGLTRISFNIVDGSVHEEATLNTGRIIRSNKLETNVKRMIASGGTDLFIAGHTRAIDQNAKIGVHSWYDDNEQLEATALPKDHPRHQPYIQYYKEMGLSDPEGFYFFTIHSANSENMHWMTTNEMIKYGLGDPTNVKVEDGIAFYYDPEMDVLIQKSILDDFENSEE